MTGTEFLSAIRVQEGMTKAAIGRWAASLVVALTVPITSASAEEPRCQGELPAVQREASAAPLSSEKQTQVKALLEQVERACKAKNDVVAMAGIDQVRAIITAERKSGSGS